MKKDFTRRQLMRNALLAASGASLGSLTSSQVFGAPDDYQGKLLVTLQLNGGADVTAFCDPKVNTPGEPKINHWADEGVPLQSSGISYAPFAKNEQLFKKYGSKMLVVNGVDAQTNAHSTGILYNWSGRNSVGAPSLTALHAARRAPDLALSYASMGGFSATSGLVRFTRVDDINAVRGLLNPFINTWDGEPSRPLNETDLVSSFVNDSIADLEAASTSPRQLRTLNAFKESRASRAGLTKLLDILPAEDGFEPSEPVATPDGMESDLKKRMQGALLIFKSGLGSAADIEIGGFDSHDENDAYQDPLFSHVADAIDFFWTYAKQLGIANRITMVIGTDFGRTNFYNDGNGKDHWNIGSHIVMANNPSWGGRVVGLTDDLHFAIPINPSSLKTAPSNGLIMTPAHVHRALRKELGLHEFAEAAGFRLDVEDVDMFNPAKRTV